MNCKVCKLAVAEAERGRCRACQADCHIKCLKGKTREQMLCPLCSEGASGGDDTRRETLRGDRFSLLELPLSSTLHPASERVALLERENAALIARMENLEARLTATLREASRPESAPTGERSREDERSREEGTMNRSQKVIFDSVKLEPLTKAELECRKHVTPLPLFDGTPTKWFQFVSCEKDSTAKCGFSPVERMERLSASLQGPARRLVAHLLERPHKVDKLMDLLEERYGVPEALLAYTSALVRDMAPLWRNASGLANVSSFYADVMTVQDALESMDESDAFTPIVESIIRTKIPQDTGREWLAFKAKNKTTISLFAEFVEKLMNEVNQLQEYDFNRPHKPVVSRPPAPVPRAPRQRVLQVQEVGPPAPAAVNTASCVMGCCEQHQLNRCPVFLAATVDGRWQVVKEKRRCTCCLGSHFVRRCRQRVKCTATGCDRVHHPLLHSEPTGQGQPQAAPRFQEKQFVGINRVSKETMFRVVPVVVSANGREQRTFALLDTGSTVSFIKTGLARELGLQGAREQMTVAWTDEVGHPIMTERVKVHIVGADGKSRPVVVNTFDELSLPKHSVEEHQLIEEGLQSLPIARIRQAVPQLLLGLDNAVLLEGHGAITGRSGKVIATETPLGWVVMGTPEERPQTCLMTREDHKLHQLVEEYIEADHFGLIEDGKVCARSEDELRALELLERNTRRVGSRYQSALLWRAEEAVLPDNWPAAVRRHKSFLTKLRREPALWQRVTDIMSEHERKGYITPAALGQSAGRKWYLPIFTVCNPNKPGKVRVVWDGAAEFHGVSLNSQLLVGPDLNAALVNVLMRFRLGKVAISGDIDEMFHRVMIHPRDWPAQRFLFQGIHEEEPRVMEATVAIFGAACSPTMAQYVKNVNADRFAEKDPRAVQVIKEQTYVDDQLDSDDSAEALLSRTRRVIAIHQSGGFHIGKWASNEPSILRQLGATPTEEVIMVSSKTSVLGLNWLTVTDALSFRWRTEIVGPLEGSLPTKRQLLRIAMSVYDPLGLIGFITVLPRIILREVWRSGEDWDQEINEGLREDWNVWLECLTKLAELKVPRWYGNLGRRVELHVFVDASDKATAAVLYVRSQDPERPRGTLVASKCKAAPLRTKSIPRLELDAALMGTRLLDMVRGAKCWEVARVTMWSDARDVLYWIRRRDKKYTPYVANRVGNILRASSAADWRWVPSEENPADWATKYRLHQEEELWWNGPAFLQKGDREWPMEDDEPIEAMETVNIVGDVKWPPSCQRWNGSPGGRLWLERWHGHSSLLLC